MRSVGPVERGQRLHRGPRHQHLAGGDAALDAAGQRRLAPVGARRRVPGDRVVGLAPPPPGHLEAVADLHALHGLDRHERPGQQRVELAVPVHVAAQPHRHAVGEHLDDAAEAVAVLGRRLDLGDHLLLGGGVEAAHRGLVDLRAGRPGRAGSPPSSGRRPSGSTWLTMSTSSSASSALATEPAATRAAVSRAEARSSTSRASVKPYFCMPARSAWPGRTSVSGALVGPSSARTDISFCHLSGSRSHSVFPISMATGEPERPPVPHPADDRDLVLLEPHPRPAPVAQPPPRQLRLHLLHRDREARPAAPRRSRRARAHAIHPRSGT